VIYSRDGESSQSLYTHRECLRRTVVTEIVLLPQLEED